jgi:toxin-antitoxin system PIN domain toxin
VLVYAHRDDMPLHEQCRRWIEEEVGTPRAFGLADVVLTGFLRLVTDRRVFAKPTPWDVADAAMEALRNLPNAVLLEPGPRHWNLFIDLCRRVGANGRLVPDAYLAALAMDTGSELITADRHFARFPGLRWRHPLA